MVCVEAQAADKTVVKTCSWSGSSYSAKVLSFCDLIYVGTLSQRLSKTLTFRNLLLSLSNRLSFEYA